MIRPNGWALASGRDLFAFVTSGSRGWAAYYAAKGALFIRMGNLDHDTLKLQLADLQHVQPPQGSEGARTKLQANDILVSITAELGMVGLVPSDLGEAYINQHLALVRPDHALDARYVAWYLASEADGKGQLLHTTRGATKASLGLDDIRDLSIPLPPRAEQGRIADKLDALLARVDACRERINRVLSALTEFRQATLRAATNGDLTADWRVRRGIEQAWQRCVLSDIADIQSGAMKDAKRQMAHFEELPYLRVANVQRGWLDLLEVKTIGLPTEKTEKLLLRRGDVLFNEGGDIDKLGRGWVWEGQIERCVFQNHVFRARLRDSTIQPKFISWWGNSVGHEYFLRAGKQTTNLASINKSVLSNLPLLLPSADEQAEIVRRVDSLFALADAIEAKCKTARAQVERLTPAILAKAFRGELVPQDPNDEPASALLARIQAERGAAPARKTRASKSTGGAA